MNFPPKKSIAIIGGGPSALFLFRHLLQEITFEYSIDIFESQHQLGSGMPYSELGSGKEHLANVSSNEIPPLVSTVADWIEIQDPFLLNQFQLDKKHFHEYKVLPRLLLGHYLRDQFQFLLEEAKKKNIVTRFHLNSMVTDISTKKTGNKITVEVNGTNEHVFDAAIICTGHSWLKKNETTYSGYFDSPYPPGKIQLQADFPVAIRGSSLTAIDAIKTLARQHGKFVWDASHHLSYHCDEANPQFKIVMHSIDGLLPAVRFHLDDPKLNGKGLLTVKEIQHHRLQNNGFVSLDYLFEKDFKAVLQKKDPSLYELVKEMTLEEFVGRVMNIRERINPFLLFKAEYDEAIKSIKQKESIYWKELLAILSGALNSPAKYLCAEDMLRLKTILVPLIAIVIASVPQASCEEMLALHEAGRLQVIAVDHSSEVIPQKEGGIIYSYLDEAGNKQNKRYHLFIDCIGQPQLSIPDFPFRSLVNDGDLKQASLQFCSAATAKKLIKEGNKAVFTKNDQDYYLEVPGIAITDSFSIVNQQDQVSKQIYVMAVPFIGGLNPDYSGLGFCNLAAEKIVSNINFANNTLARKTRKPAPKH